MRPLVGLGLLLGLVSACSGDGRQTAVVPASIHLSPDRRTLTVATFYPTSFNCGKQPGGLDVDVHDDVVLVTAVMKSNSNGGDCDLECGSVTQTITLSEPLPADVRFEAPADADPGCGSPDMLTIATTPSTFPATPPSVVGG
jgi:hypothetical protein